MNAVCVLGIPPALGKYLTDEFQAFYDGDLSQKELAQIVQNCFNFEERRTGQVPHRFDYPEIQHEH